jgi:hypothetical protein
LAILCRSFRSLARAVLPLALLLILSGCGGGTKTTPVSTRVVRGPGFSFSAPDGWKSSRTQHAVAASSGGSRVSVTTYTLQKTYRPALFSAAAKELDGVAAKLAAQAGKPLAAKETIKVAGQKIRSYRFGSTHIGFVLVGKREYELLCQLPPDGHDAGGACALLFQSFSVA